MSETTADSLVTPRKALGSLALLAYGPVARRNVAVEAEPTALDHLVVHDLVDELHLTILPVIAGEGLHCSPAAGPSRSGCCLPRTWAGSGNILAIYQPILRELVPD